jgi:hypothetical protein
MVETRHEARVGTNPRQVWYAGARAVIAVHTPGRKGGGAEATGRCGLARRYEYVGIHRRQDGRSGRHIVQSESSEADPGAITVRLRYHESYAITHPASLVHVMAAAWAWGVAGRRCCLAAGSSDVWYVTYDCLAGERRQSVRRRRSHQEAQLDHSAPFFQTVFTPRIGLRETPDYSPYSPVRSSAK